MAQTVLIGLAASSTITGLMTEAAKKILDETGKDYYSNILAALVAIFTGTAMGTAYVIYTGVGFTPQNVIAIIALVVLTFLCATLGYDKVIQTLTQIGGSE